MMSGDALHAYDALSSCAVQELSLTLGMAYLAFYVANSPQIAGTSGVIAVVVMGIYGSATGKWDMSPRFAESGFFYRCRGPRAIPPRPGNRPLRQMHDVTKRIVLSHVYGLSSSLSL